MIVVLVVQWPVGYQGYRVQVLCVIVIKALSARGIIIKLCTILFTREELQMTTVPSVNTNIDRKTVVVEELTEKGKKRLSDLSSANGETKNRNDSAG